MTNTTVWVSFSDLKPGEIFRFVYNATLNPKMSGEYFVKGEHAGWYRKLNDANPRAWRTGPMTAVIAVSARVRRFECCCCGGEAPAHEHWFNRDAGFGLCGRCATMIQARKDYDPVEFTSNYGHQGVHWFVGTREEK